LIRIFLFNQPIFPVTAKLMAFNISNYVWPNHLCMWHNHRAWKHFWWYWQVEIITGMLSVSV